MKNLKTILTVQLSLLILCTAFTMQSSDSATDEMSAFAMSMPEGTFEDAFGEVANTNMPTTPRMPSFPKLETTITPLDANNANSAQQSAARRRRNSQDSTSSESSSSNSSSLPSQRFERLIKKDSINSYREILEDFIPITTTNTHQVTEYVRQSLDKLARNERLRRARSDDGVAPLTNHNAFGTMFESGSETTTDSSSDILVIYPFQVYNSETTPSTSNDSLFVANPLEPLSANYRSTNNVLPIIIAQADGSEKSDDDQLTEKSLFKRLFSCCLDLQ